MLSLTINGTDLTAYLAPKGLKRTKRMVMQSVTTMDGMEHVAKVALKYDWSIQFRPLTDTELSIIETAMTDGAYFEAIVADPVNGTSVHNLKMPNRPITYLTPEGDDDYWTIGEIVCTEL